MPHRPRARNLELSITLLVLAGGAPAVVVALWLLWRTDLPIEVRWTITAAVALTWIISASVARQMAVRSLQLVANLLGALREGDYSIRGLSARSGSSMAGVMREVNDLGSTLQRQRTEAVESTALLTHVMEEIAVAVFAFDPSEHVLLINKAGEKLLGQSEAAMIGQPASAFEFGEYLTGEPRRLVERTIGGRRGRFEVRRASFYRDGRPHHLVVMADLSQALREEEQAAWQRIVRVLSHEINNSLTPIKSIAHSVKRIIERVGGDGPNGEKTGGFERQHEVVQGLSLIEERSGALGRFLRAYAQLARLPKPQPKPVTVPALIGRIVELEKRLPVRSLGGPDVMVIADSDQLEQLLINIVRNAVDASLDASPTPVGARGGVTIAWRATSEWLEVEIDDDGKGLPDTSNLFVPFFTTKPNGSGIGLALSRQIAEAHGGTLTLENRTGTPGCRALLRIPVGAR
ncbi:MAG: PAS domain-containing protein [Acidobacteria bacterium]|nr:PAS domain-containing protein [Acidobacteriota bacterium]